MKKRLLKKRIRQLEAENEILKKVVHMTDSQIKQWRLAVIDIARKLK